MTFDTAAFVLAGEMGDFYHYEQYDEDHSEKEDRYLTVSSHPQDRSFVLAIVWTERAVNKRLVTRIISARFAARKEHTQYVQYINEKTRS